MTVVLVEELLGTNGGRVCFVDLISESLVSSCSSALTIYIWKLKLCPFLFVLISGGVEH